MLVYIKVEKYSSASCDYTTKIKYSLEVHTRTHSGVKPFDCPNCEKQFTQKALLIKHTSKHHTQQPTANKSEPEEYDYKSLLNLD